MNHCQCISPLDLLNWHPEGQEPESVGSDPGLKPFADVSVLEGRQGAVRRKSKDNAKD